jgi:hypothetical protein
MGVQGVQGFKGFKGFEGATLEGALDVNVHEPL